MISIRRYSQTRGAFPRRIKGRHIRYWVLSAECSHTNPSVIIFVQKLKLVSSTKRSSKPPGGNNSLFASARTNTHLIQSKFQYSISMAMQAGAYPIMNFIIPRENLWTGPFQSPERTLFTYMRTYWSALWHPCFIRIRQFCWFNIHRGDNESVVSFKIAWL